MIARALVPVVALSAVFLGCSGRGGDGETGSSGAGVTDGTGAAGLTTTGAENTGTSPTTGGPLDTTGIEGSTTGGTTTDEVTGGEDTGTTAPVEPGTTGTGGSSGGGSSGDDSSGGDSSTGEPSPWDGEPLPPAAVGEWTWVDVPEAKCRDGSSTGIGVRYGSGEGLVIYFQSGGACFNAATCNQNTTNFGPGKFATFMAQNGTKGIFDPANPSNPVGDWSYVFVPYCTGDVHAGSQVNGTLEDVAEVQQFVGYTNVGHYLERIVPTFGASAEHVLVTGESAGGFGALFNYDRIVLAFPYRPVTLLDDSGPVLPDGFLNTCLQVLWRTAWNLEANLPADCSSCFPQDGGALSSMFSYLGDKHSDQSLGLISSQSDATITYFFEFGLNACQGGKFGPADFATGLAQLRDIWMTGDAWSTYYPKGNQHTWLLPSYYTSQVGGKKLTTWISDLLAGVGTHVSD